METAKEVNFKELFEIIIKKWWLILLLTIVGFGIAYIYTVKYVTPVYEANTVLYIGQEGGSLGSIDVSLGQLNANSQLLVDYKQIASTRLVVNEVIKNLGLNISYDQFRNNVIIESVLDSRLFTVGFRHSDPQLAKQISDELAKQLTVAVLQIVGVENIRILDQALVPQVPISPNVPLNTIIGGLLGFFISLFVIILMFLMNDTVMNEDDIEKLIGIAVLGDIPEFKGEVR
ncbi:MAG: Wzz/FepE/Etk N-terminal domain-containing protein [Acetobacterium sp.]|nr:Wzz/FepE/Etk N-terminal domain-containing protein [Acetobacterium sp.]